MMGRVTLATLEGEYVKYATAHEALEVMREGEQLHMPDDFGPRILRNGHLEVSHRALTTMQFGVHASHCCPN